MLQPELRFQPLERFSLAWRWTRPEHHQLPAEVLATIEPLSATSAEGIACEAVEMCSSRRVAEWEMSICAEYDEGFSVRQRLLQLGVPRHEQVLVSWDAHTAVRTRWGTFVDYWDAFCYPSSDDVTVWNPDADWVLCYRHFQHMEFGRRTSV